MLLEVLAFIAALIAAVLLPILLLQVPKIKALIRARAEEQGDRSRAGVRRLTGLAGIAGLPLYGFAFPYAAVAAAAMIFVRPLAPWPAWTKALVAWSLAGIVALALIARYQGQAVSGNVLYYAATALFVTAAVKMTTGEASAAQLLGYAAIGSGLFFVIFKPINTDTFEHLWKYGIGPYIAIASVWFLCSTTHRRLLPMLALIVVGSASLFLGFRSHGLVCFITAVLLMGKGKNRQGKFPISRVIVTGVAFLGLYRVLPAAVESGVFGEAVRLRTASQLGEDGPALLAGRVEPPLSIAAISERPLFGWGNLNGIDFDTISSGANLAYKMGLLPVDFMHLWVRTDGQVSVHSVLAEGWIEGGIVAASLPLLLLGIFIAAIWRSGGTWAPLVILVSIQGIWDVLFSTWGYNRPFILAISAVLAAWAITGNKAVTAQAAPSDGYLTATDRLTSASRICPTQR